MCTAPSIPDLRRNVKPTCRDHQLADRITQEIDDLIVEIFATTWGFGWDEATDEALASFADLIAYADEYDMWAEAYNN